MKELAYLNHYFLRYKWELLLGILFVILSNIFAIYPAQLVRHSFDLIADTIQLYPLLQGSDLQSQMYDAFALVVLYYGTLIVAMAFIRGVFLFFMRQTIIVVSRKIEYDLKNTIFNHYQELPLSFYRRNNTGDLMNRISEDVGQVRMYLGPAIMYGLNLLFSCLLIISYMLMTDVRLTLWSLLPLPFLSVSIYYVNTLINQRSEAIQRSLSDLSTFVQEAFSGIRVLKAFVREEDSYRRFEAESETYRSRSLELVRVDSLFFPVMMALIGLSTILTVYVGGIEVVNGTITPGNIAEFVIYINMLTWPVTSIGWVTSIVQRAEASQKRINEFLSTQSDIVSGHLKAEIRGDLRFEGVSLTYPDSGILALDQVSFEVKAGDSLAILGTTGSGKTTMANLICRMYDTTGGRVLIDGRDIRDYQLPNLRGQIGYVPQDVFLFSDTIRANIAFGADQASEEDILRASRQADLHHNIESFPQGYDTVVGERGITLSGGQKQRTAIARAIIRRPAIMILDDSLSAVDTKTENAILNSLRDIMQGRTSIIISHRISSAKLARQILVLDAGRIVQAGTHDELIRQEGMYKDLYEKQLNAEEETAV